MYLVDTNIWLEVLLEQDKKHDAHKFLTDIDPTYLNITDFTIYSIGIILTKLGELDLLERFYKDVIYESGVNIIRLAKSDIFKIIKFGKKHNLDFDDSYQYTSARKYNLKIVSFDSDFDKTDLRRITPTDALNRK